MSSIHDLCNPEGEDTPKQQRPDYHPSQDHHRPEQPSPPMHPHYGGPPPPPHGRPYGDYPEPPPHPSSRPHPSSSSSSRPHPYDRHAAQHRPSGLPPHPAYYAPYPPPPHHYDHPYDPRSVPPPPHGPPYPSYPPPPHMERDHRERARHSGGAPAPHPSSSSHGRHGSHDYEHSSYPPAPPPHHHHHPYSSSSGKSSSSKSQPSAGASSSSSHPPATAHSASHSSSRKISSAGLQQSQPQPQSQSDHHHPPPHSGHSDPAPAVEEHRRTAPVAASSSSSANIPDDQRPAKIKIVQQPLHARMCGFGEKDRRPVDPPPIVQLLLDENHSQHPARRLMAQQQQQQQQQNRSDAAAAAASTSTQHQGTVQRGDDGDRNPGDATQEDGYDDEDGNKRKRQLPERSTRARSGSLKLENSGADSATLTSSPPTLGKRSRSFTKNEGKNEEDENSEARHSSDDEDDKDDGEGVHGGLGDGLQEQDPLFVLHVSLWSQDGSEVRNMIATPGQSEPPKLTRILMGSLVVSPILLNNAEGVPGWYFSFPDLSIRTEGVYTLKFSLMRFGSFDFLNNDDGHASTLVAEEISQPFTVFSAKKFPGMTESTDLSKAFAKQGLKIPIRNDLRARKSDRD